MKNSNKLLLGGFLTVILLISAIHITLYAKYRNGNYTIYNDDLQSMAMQFFPHVKFVSISNVENVSVRFSDSLKVEKLEGNEIRYTQRGDTLHIDATDTSKQNRYWDEVHIQLPGNTPLTALNSKLSFEKSNNSSDSIALIYLDGSKAYFSPDIENLQNGPIRINSITIKAVNKSSVVFQNAMINKVNVNLFGSTLHDENGNIGELHITADSLSRISLPVKLFSKAKINTPAQE